MASARTAEDGGRTHKDGSEDRELERREVLVSAEELARQKEYMQRVRALADARTRAPTALVDTFGCQQNVADGEVLAGMLAEMGFAPTTDARTADVVLLNTCAIREHAEKRVFGALGELTHAKAAKPEQVLVLCGCMAQQKRIADKVRESYRHVDLVLGPQAEWRLPELLYGVLTEHSRTFAIEDEHGRIAEGLPVRRDGTVRAWVSIMYGCNNFCSYCIVPYVRGRERSRDPERIIAECRELIAAGYREIYLLGQNVNSYGNDLPIDYDFADLLRAIDAIEGDYWLRFMSSQPKDATPKLFETMARCRHVAKCLHLPVQSGNDRVLRAMRRPYTRAGYLELIACARRAMPELVLTSDVIIGFPGETEAEAMDTVSLVEEARFDALFTFIFSPRPGTPAAQMEDNVPRAEKQRWFDRLLAVQNAYSAEKHAAYVGRTLRVLIDGESDDPAFPLSCRTEGNRLVRAKGDRARIGSFATARITDSNTWALYGEVLSE
ncbi:MAG: tRNA (N6-isopentenyl adenosine(37)-C2)-methylthiotransferase MiaB [Oscillospiraceae bacterium]|nr:tRNA (N6-isopentenyl adenosine(37)-C2)-methylthiotransferase MiaB [Oscillospiraceae bacterium]